MKESNEQKLELCKLAVADWRGGKLHDISFIQVIVGIIDPEPITKAAMEWGKETLEKLQKEGLLK